MRGRQISAVHLCDVILLVIMLVGIASAPAAANLLAQLKATGVLRVCADPDNLPFSGQEPREPGYDVELAGEIAKGLGSRAEITWVSTVLGRSALRQILEGKCDLFMGLPHDQRFLDENRRLALSTPYYALQHLLISPRAQPINTLGELRGRKVGVERMSFGDIFLFQNGQRRGIYPTQSEAFQALVRGEVEAALLWAPIGGWLIKKHPEGQLQAVDVSAPDLGFMVGVGMRQGDEEFQTALNEVVQRMVAVGKVADILARYGLPFFTMAQAAAESKQGRSLYYQICAPCHGQSGEGGGPVPNLKAFQGTEERFLKISLDGKPDRGMPAWKGKLTEDELRSILVFIQSLPQ